MADTVDVVRNKLIVQSLLPSVQFIHEHKRTS
jgi:hypothetical protein